MHKIWVLVPLLLPALAACNNDEINRLLNGSSASADTTQRQPYGAEGTITQSEAPTLKGLLKPGELPNETGIYLFAQPQSREAMTGSIGFENSYQGNSSFYKLKNGGEVEIIHNESGQAIGLRQNLGGNR